MSFIRITNSYTIYISKITEQLRYPSRMRSAYILLLAIALAFAVCVIPTIEL